MNVSSSSSSCSSLLVDKGVSLDDHQPHEEEGKLMEVASMEVEQVDSVYKLRKDCLSNLHLRRIMKENHGKRISSIAFNDINGCDKRLQHMVASCGGGLVSVYDNDHCDGHFDLSCIFENKATPYSCGGIVTEVTWLKVPTKTHQQDDIDDVYNNEALLAFGGEGKEIGIVSISETRVVELLTGHTGAILDLCADPNRDGFLLSLSADKTVRFWNAVGATCLVVYDLSKFSGNPTCLGLHPQGNKFAIGFDNGQIIYVDAKLDEEMVKEGIDNNIVVVNEENSQILCKKRAKIKVDCIKFMDDSTLMVHEMPGKLIVWNVEVLAPVMHFLIPRGESKSPVRRIRFGLSECRNFVCVGNKGGEVFIFDLLEGKRINKLSMTRIKGVVMATCFAPECKSVLVCTNDSIIWRWDYVKKEDLPK